METRKTETSFNICLVKEPAIFGPDVASVLFVHNLADSSIPGVGKPAGFGFPGGGVALDQADNPKTAAIREMEAETGIRPTGVIYLMSTGKMILVDSKTQRMILQKFFTLGQRPTMHADKGKNLIENPVHIFKTNFPWHSSKLRKLFLKAHDEFSRNLPGYDPAKNGIQVFFSDWEEDVPNLGIEELGEIDGVGLFPLPVLEEMLSDYEEIDPASGKKVIPQSGREIYLSHIKWLFQGLQIMLTRARIRENL